MMKNKTDEILHHIRHYLPSQTPIKDFIHHNTLHAFQDQKFFDAIFLAAKNIGYNVTLSLDSFRELYRLKRISQTVLEDVIADKYPSNIELWKDRLLSKTYNTHNEPLIGQLRKKWKQYCDIETMVQPVLFRVLSSYLDQGIAHVKFPLHPNGFLASIAEIESKTSLGIFKTKKAKRLLLDNTVGITDLLAILVASEAYYEQYLFDLCFSHHGWSGLVAAIEDAPDTLLDGRKISLAEMIQLELLLEIDALNYYVKDWKPLAVDASIPPQAFFGPIEHSEIQQVLILWQTAFEWSYYHQVIKGISNAKTTDAITKPRFQAIFCIDERECSLRRNLEMVDPEAQTMGAPGFFGSEFYFQPYGAQFYDKLCPAPVTPKFLIKEIDIEGSRDHDFMYTGKLHQLGGGLLSSLVLWIVAFYRLITNLFHPKMSPAISNAYTHMLKNSKLTIENTDPRHIENGLQIGYNVTEMSTRVEAFLRGIGLVKDFAPIVYTVAHGSSSANNPHHAAHDCGACSGRPGSVNARVFASMANHLEVRKALSINGIDIPSETVFIGSMHDTSADLIEYYDDDLLTELSFEIHKKNKISFEKALDLNANERTRRFASIDAKGDIKKARKAIFDRSASLFEPRPELGHGTNSLCIVGHRDLTKGVFLDRRAFLNSYDYRTDPNGEVLANVMKPVGLVCGGINLEYYFSRVDNYKFGAGTKLPHNVVGLFSVANSSDGDLRPGLPLQMIEVHDPVRLLVIVEHKPEVVHKAIQSSPEVYEWYLNEWVHIMAFDPFEKQFYYFKNGSFLKHQVLDVSVSEMNRKDTKNFFATSKKMETNNIEDATFENLPIYTLKD